MDLKQICSLIESAARETGEYILKESEVFDIKKAETKGLNDFVSYVDKGSEKMLIEKLSSILPEAGFHVEEGTLASEGRIYNWIVDPLDGTTNFIHGLHPFAISIGLKEYDEVIAGVVYEVGGHETFSAWKDGGAWLNGRRINVSGIAEVSGSLIATGFPYHYFDRLTPYLNCLTYFLKNTHGVRRLGSASIDLAYVACGRFEVFFEYELKSWDIAAGMLIVREAGGYVSDFSGNMKNLTGAEVIAANDLVYSEILKIVGNFMNDNTV
jgi:myo-inositol-1(or 4)-monophosphatase